MRTLIAVMSHNRKNHLAACLKFLAKSDLTDCDVHVLCDGDVHVEPIVDHYGFAFIETDIVLVAHLDKGEGLEKDLGRKRRIACCQALKGDYDYLLLLDDDILLGPDTVQEAVADYEMLQGHPKFPGGIGGLSLHVPHNLSGMPLEELDDGSAWYGPKLGGEANMLISKASLKQRYDKFGYFSKGFGDVFIDSIWENAEDYVTKASPHYQVQHIGIGVGASVCHSHKAKLPHWVREFYKSHVTDRPIAIEGFTQSIFSSALSSVGALDAPRVLLNRIEKEIVDGCTT